jgi:hypothetical protein
MTSCGGVAKKGVATLNVGFATYCPLVFLGPSAPKVMSCGFVATIGVSTLGVDFTTSRPMASPGSSVINMAFCEISDYHGCGYDDGSLLGYRPDDGGRKHL